MQLNCACSFPLNVEPFPRLSLVHNSARIQNGTLWRCPHNRVEQCTQVSRLFLTFLLFRNLLCGLRPFTDNSALTHPAPNFLALAVAVLSEAARGQSRTSETKSLPGDVQRRRRQSFRTVWQQMQPRFIIFRCTSHIFISVSRNFHLYIHFKSGWSSQQIAQQDFASLSVATICTAHSRIMYPYHLIFCLHLQQTRLHFLFSQFRFFMRRHRWLYVLGPKVATSVQQSISFPDALLSYNEPTLFYYSCFESLNPSCTRETSPSPAIREVSRKL